jgi:diadenylate cyclase
LSKISSDDNKFKVSDDMRRETYKDWKDTLSLLAPGTQLREGLENILKAKTGALIVLSNNENVMNISDGGFSINADYNPSYIYEVAKMDGAIIISSDLKKIISANTQMIPDSTIITLETGTRHRTANRVAKQTGAVVIAISQRRNIITVYKNETKYVLRDSSVIVGRANQAIQTLEKYVVVLDKVINNLNILEFEDMVTLFDVIASIQRSEMVMRIVEEVERYICELGNEGRLISMQLAESTRTTESDEILLIKDYCKDNNNLNEIYEQIQELDSEQLMDIGLISKLLGYNGTAAIDTLISPRGYRMMSKVPRIPLTIIENVVKNFKELKAINDATFEDLDKVDGIGEARAKAIKNGLIRIKEKVLFR